MTPDLNDRQTLTDTMTALFRACAGNLVSADAALPGCEGLRMFEEPLFGFADAEDPLFARYKEEGVIGPLFMGPREWLPAARTVISWFLPFTERVRKSNYGDPEIISPEWLHARIEGQAFMNLFAGKLAAWFAGQGAETCIPSQDPRFKAVPGTASASVFSGAALSEPDLQFASTWSERHAAYAAGLGTFSMTRGLISRKGVAGRYGSLLVSWRIDPDVRPYRGVYDYCIRCGACADRCPVGAITAEYGKNNNLCAGWVRGVTAVRYAPRYGCGKCQTQVPCETGIPGVLF